MNIYTMFDLFDELSIIDLQSWCIDLCRPPEGSRECSITVKNESCEYKNSRKWLHRV